MRAWRIKRLGVQEFLTIDGALTTDPKQAALFEWQSTAVLFLLETLDDHSLWDLEFVRVADVVAA
jgi:hypothetical protein